MLIRTLMLSLLVVAAHAVTATAQCTFNSSRKATVFKFPMVRAFEGCLQGLHPVINTATGNGTPACNPVLPASVEGATTPYKFSQTKGTCSVSGKTKVLADCSVVTDSAGNPLGLPAGACQVTYVKASCKGILESDGLTFIKSPDDDDWSLSMLTRMTTSDATNGDMTVIDFPISFSFQPPHNGSISLSANSAEALAAILVDISGAALSPCTNLELLRLTIKDPMGLPFARIGLSTRPLE